MTREELEARAQAMVMAVNGIFRDQWGIHDQRDYEYILDVLIQVEREAFCAGLQAASTITLQHHHPSHWYLENVRKKIASAIEDKHAEALK